MPSVSIHSCRPMVQARTPFRASSLHAAWKTADDGTRMYVVESRMMPRRGGVSACTLFVYCDGAWFECNEVPSRPHWRKRMQQKQFARPVAEREITRMERWELHRFATHGLAHHPDMARLLRVSV